MRKSAEKKLEQYKKIDKVILSSTYIFLSIPIVIHLIFWFKWYISFPATAALLVGIAWLIKNINYKTLSEYKNIFNIRTLSISFLILFFVNLLSGAGGLMFQNWDYHSRNALLHDLVEKQWPVKYDLSNQPEETKIIGSSNGLLSYYFAWFLPSAALGKITHSFSIASLGIFIWNLIGINLIFYLIFRKFNKSKISYLFIVFAISGLDILISAIINLLNNSTSIFPEIPKYIDTSVITFSMHGFFTHLFWVFNQSIPAWIICLLFINNPRYSSMGILFSMMAIYAPLPAIGLFILFILFIFAGVNFNSYINSNRIKILFSIKNFLPIVFMAPIAMIFLQNSSRFGFIFNRPYGFSVNELLMQYFLYLTFEIGIFLLFINKNNKNKIIALFLVLAIMPLFYIGVGYDFGNRATIPVFIFMTIEAIRSIEQKHTNIRKYLITSAIALSSITGIYEIYRTILFTYKAGGNHHRYFSDTYKTFDNFSNKECVVFINNFIAKDSSDSFLNKYILRNRND